jgi:hypothetical protein
VIFVDKDRRQEELHYDEDGEMAVHQQITEAYQSGVVDRLTEEEQQHAKEKQE